MDELEQIDALFTKIEVEIQDLAGREKKEVGDIERLLELAAEAATSVGTGGLDKIVERDDEGGGEQAEDEEDQPYNLHQGPTLAEEIDRIYSLKQ